MNAKKSKALRKVVRNMVANHSEEIPTHSYSTVRNSEKTLMVDKKDDDGNVTGVEKLVLFTGQQVNAPKSQRAVYLQLKKELKKV